MIAPDYGQKRYHVGRLLESEENREIFRDATLEADDKAFFLKVQDTVRLAIDQAKFAHLVSRLHELLPWNWAASEALRAQAA